MIRNLLIVLFSLFLFACDHSDPGHEEYFKTINQAELQIANNNFESAARHYNKAFENIEKPFGKDVYNAAIVNSITGNQNKLLSYIQTLVNNSEDILFIESTLVNTYVSREDWNRIIKKRKIVYNKSLRYEMEKIKERDQEFRPLYDTFMDTIEKIRRENLERIFQSTSDNELPGHQEIGYPKNLVDQPHHIVFYHTVQRRSQDKNVGKLDTILQNALRKGKIDPEQALLYLKFQNDLEAGPYEVYTVFQIQHPLLPDSLQNRSWEMNINGERRIKADSVRRTWWATSLDDLSYKANYLKNSEHPFIFSGIQRAIYELPLELNKKEVMEQYELQTSRGIEHKAPANN